MMKKISLNLLLLMICAVLLTILIYPKALSAKTCEPWAAKVVSVQGTVEVKKADETQWQTAKLNDTYCAGDVIRVEENSRADIALVNQPVLRLDQNTTITLGGMKEERTSLIDMLKGAAHFFSRAPKSIEVRTAFVNAGVEGTEFFIKVDENQTFLTVFEGKVLAQNEAGRVGVAGGQSAVAEKGKAPVLRVVAKPRDAVQWALYYPPIKYVPPEGMEVKEDTNGLKFLVNRASKLISVGRVDEASADLERALSLDPNYSDAYALQSIIAVVQNEKEKALDLANKAVQTGPKSATALIALSYAQQASFNLEGARASLEQAVQVEPENALAWARLAEMWSSFGYLDKSLKAAKQATSLAPDLERTQTVLGFAYLTEVKTTEAKAAFEKAIKLDQAAPLPRLGMGLAKIREGDLQDGGREIEIAASLDPNNSLIRSYLGKVYYEEKRGKIDGEEFAIAKELDPKDPTPWFYDAIAKQTTNRPVEALHDIQKAIELNDNRAVYRSKLQLDSDQAARSASLARIYSDLGFQQRALAEGWNSVNTDPTNFSAHRFLADSYSALPRHEIARVSELLISQLLQPTNITPIQPQAAESNLFLISSQGPSATGFNTYNPLFNRNQATVQASGMAGENDTWSGEGIVSAIYNKLSLSAGYSKFHTDGWRENGDQDDGIANAFVQIELTHKTSIQAEYRYRDNELGDLTMRGFEDDFFNNLRQEYTTKTYRLGFRHSFSPSSDLIGYYQHADGDRSQNYTFPLPIPPAFPTLVFDQKGDLNSKGGELQYLFRSQYINFVGGGGYFDIGQTDHYFQGLDVGAPTIVPIADVTANGDVDHANGYIYIYVNLLKNFTFTLGSSYDDFSTADELVADQDQFNPKFGITWNPFPATTLRGAAFRVLKRTLITDQTIEPTQVAGFNQFYDEADGTDYWIYGGALDQKFTNSIYGGTEYAYKDIDVPYISSEGPIPEAKTANWTEKVFRAYLFWVPHDWLALSAEYLWERFDREDFVAGAKTLETNSFPLGINFFHPSGLSASLKGTYVKQQGSFERLDAPRRVYTDGDDDFFLVDAAIRYRFPKRYGFFTLGVSNLTDENFNFFDSDIDNPRFQPERSFFAKITIALP